MLALSTALTMRLLPGLSTEPPREEGMRTWIERGNFYFGMTPIPDQIILQNVRMAEMAPFLSYDFERFALSSLESALGRGPELMGSRALGWPLARLYYSAFFGAHAIMRGTGRAVFRIENSQAVRLSQLGSFYLEGFKVSSGTYHSILTENQNGTIDCQFNKLPEAGGAHDQFWRTFHDFLGSISAELISNKETESTAVAAETSELRDILCSNGFNGGTWLSVVRNQLTYQHKHGAWFPFQKSDAKAVEYVRRLSIKDSAAIRRDHDATKSPLLAFAACCQIISSLSSELVEGLCQRPGTHRLRRLLNQLRAAEAT